MPTTLPPAYASPVGISDSFISLRSLRFAYLALLPVLMLIINFAVIAYEHRSLRTPEKADLKFSLAFCDEMASCGLAEVSSIRKMKRR